MRRDWSMGAQDDLAVDPRLNRTPRPVNSAEQAGLQVRLPLMCLLAGVLAALVYAWPVLLVVDIMSGGFRPALFAWILGGSALLAAVAFWAVTGWERRHWARNSHALGDFADPPPWK
jgi:hypothetical protein